MSVADDVGVSTADHVLDTLLEMRPGPASLGTGLHVSVERDDDRPWTTCVIELIEIRHTHGFRRGGWVSGVIEVSIAVGRAQE